MKLLEIFSIASQHNVQTCDSFGLEKKTFELKPYVVFRDNVKF